MRIFVVCAGEGKYSGRIIAKQLKYRLKGMVDVEWGSVHDLERNTDKGKRYRYVLNMGMTTRFPAGCQVLNHHTIVDQTADRKKCRMKLKIKRLPTPRLILSSVAGITEEDLPVVGRSNSTPYPADLWVCHTTDMVKIAKERGATHFVAKVESCREFRVHVVAPSVKVFAEVSSDYRVIKLSERLPINEDAATRNPMNKKEDSCFHFGEPKDHDSDVLDAVKSLARLTIKDLNLHWGSVSILVGEDEFPMVLKVDCCINLKEDQVNTVARFSNAIAKLFDPDPLPLLRRRPRHYA